jgi:hypothetical protein
VRDCNQQLEYADHVYLGAIAVSKGMTITLFCLEIADTLSGRQVVRLPIMYR